MQTLIMVIVGMALAGCNLFTYELTPPSTEVGTHQGEDCGTVFFGLGYGDLSVAQAMKNGGITTPKKVTLSQQYVLIAGQNCLTVEGEGPGVPSGTPRYPQPQ